MENKHFLKALIDVLIQAREALKEARNIKCTCARIDVQMGGCGCGAENKVLAAEKHLWALLEDL
jgi:hypothetical protein